MKFKDYLEEAGPKLDSPAWKKMPVKVREEWLRGEKPAPKNPEKLAKLPFEKLPPEVQEVVASWKYSK